jgi:hypothetical protein
MGHRGRSHRPHLQTLVDLSARQSYLRTRSLGRYQGADDQADVAGSNQNGCRDRRSGFLLCANDYEYRNPLVRGGDYRSAGLLHLTEIFGRR